MEYLVIIGFTLCPIMWGAWYGHKQRLDALDATIQSLKDYLDRRPTDLIKEDEIAAEWKAKMRECKEGSPKYEAFKKRLQSIGAL